jgi:hypothetical protein
MIRLVKPFFKKTARALDVFNLRRRHRGAQQRDECRSRDKAPCGCKKDKREEDRCAAQILGPLGKPVRVESDAIDRRLDTRVEDLDNQQEQHGADQQNALHGADRYETRKWDSEPKSATRWTELWIGVREVGASSICMHGR